MPDVTSAVSSPVSPVAGAAIGAGGDIASSLIGMLGSAYSASRGFKYWKKQFQMQNDRQDWLMLNQARMQLQGMKAAGLSVAGLGGQMNAVAQTTNPSGVSTASGSSGGRAGSAALQGMAVAQQMKQSDATVKNIEQSTATGKAQEQEALASAEKQRAEANKVQSEADRNNLELDKLKEWYDDLSKDGYSILMPEVHDGQVSLKAYTVDNPYALKEFRENFAVAVGSSDFFYSMPQKELGKAIAEVQKSDKEIFDSIVNMPKAQYDNLQQQMQESISRVGLNWSMSNMYYSQSKYYDAQTGLVPYLQQYYSASAWNQQRQGFKAMADEYVAYTQGDVNKSVQMINEAIGAKVVSEKQFIETQNWIKTNSSFASCFEALFGKDSAKWSTAQKTTLWLSFIGLSVRGVADVLDKGSGIFLNFAGGIGKLAGAFKTLKGAQGFKTTRINYNGYGNPTGSSQTWSEPYYPN